MDQDFQTKVRSSPAASLPSGNTPRFFPEGPAQLQAALENYLSWLEAQAGALAGLKALILAGGYGRGEGGIFRSPADAPPCLYNDLEFYVFAPAVESSLVRKWVHEGEKRFGIEVEFKCLPPSALENARPSMFFYDLLGAHVLVAGDKQWVDSLPSVLSQATKIPLLEAGRLLINRGMSLLRCLRWAAGERELPGDFCARISAKAKLALADAVLVVNEKYHWSCRVRHQSLSDAIRVPPGWEQLQQWHSEAVDFKFHPRVPDWRPSDWSEPLHELVAAWCTVFLWVESARCGAEFSCAGSYAAGRSRLFPEESVVRNIMRQLRDLRSGPRVPFQWGDHPRAAIWRAAVVLLSQASQGAAADSVPQAAALLGLASTTKSGEVEEVLRGCWKRYP